MRPLEVEHVGVSRVLGEVLSTRTAKVFDVAFLSYKTQWGHCQIIVQEPESLAGLAAIHT